MAFDLKDYKDVAERIRDFRDLHPFGSLQSEIVAMPSPDLPFVVVKAYAYRDQADERPGIGLAWEPFPGRTPYTKDSELQNAETSAWGRAIVAALASDTKQGVASADEIRARRESEPQTTAPHGAGSLGGGSDQGSGVASPAPTSSAPIAEAEGKNQIDNKASHATQGSRGGSAAPSDVDGGEGSDLTGEGGTGPNPSTCPHTTWADAPNPAAAARGIKVCVDCGHAEKRAA